MKQLNTSIVYAGIIVIFQALLMQACSPDVGGNEDNTEATVVLTSLNGGEEVIGTYLITWESDEPNRSTVEISISHDSGGTWKQIEQDNIPDEGIHDTGSFEWDSNGVDDCRTCRLRIIATDIVGNVSTPTDSSADFIINNVPQVYGTAFYYDTDNDGFGSLTGSDTIIVPFDKDINIFGSFPTAFKLPVLGDSIGVDVTMTHGPAANEITLTFTEGLPVSHLHVKGNYDENMTFRTAPSGIDIFGDVPLGIISAVDTGRTAAPSGGVDIAPTFTFRGWLLSVFNEPVFFNDPAFGDIDGDGDIDIVSRYQMWLNDGSGAFTARASDGGSPLELGDSITLGDVNGDDDLDLVSSAGLWFNDGSGVFTDSGQVVTGTAFGDVDGDRDLDLVGSAGLWFNDGSGVFTDSGQVVTGTAFGDVDGDGDLDLVGNGVWLNDGSGGFTDSGQAVTGTVLGDVDGDGDLDLVGSDVWWLNDGNGVFTDSGQVVELGGTVSVAGDVDGDGDFDLVRGDRLWLNDGNGGFIDSGQALDNQEINIGITHGSPEDVTTIVALGDIDGDGDLDLVRGNSDGVAYIWVNSARSPDMALFVDSSQVLDGNIGAAGDVDGDGDLDLVGSGVWLNDGTGGFIDSGQALDLDASIALGDVDGDGDLDLVGSDGSLSGGGVWLNGGSGGFTDSGQALGLGSSIALGDVDGDGDLDLVGNGVWLNDGSGGFTDSGQALGLGISNALGDVDGDGDLDLVGSGVWLNDGSGVFTDTNQLGTAFVFSSALGDVDGDGALDLVIGEFSIGYWNSVWLNDGSGVFANSGPALLTAGYSALDDVDGDGDLDLVSVGADLVNEFNLEFIAANRVWLNNGGGFFTDSGKTLGNELIASIHRNELSTSIVPGDVDGDGDVDFIIGDGGVSRVWLNDF